MRPHRPYGRQAPPWWPANEPWPPVRPGPHWRRGRARFMRRIAVLFALLLGLSAIGAATLLSWLFDRVSIAGSMQHQLPAILVLVVMIATIVILSFVAVMRRVGSPMGDLVTAANRVGSGDYSARIIERGPPFLRTVARSFNSMTEQLQVQDRRRRQLMADIAHELRTPLSVLQGRLEGLLDGVYPRDDVRMTELLEDTRMLARLVDDLRTLANAEAGNLPLRKEPTDLAVLLHDSAASFSAETREKQIALRIEERTELPLLEIDPLRVREVLTNLLANAIRHTASGGTVTVAAGVVPASLSDADAHQPGASDGRVEVIVRDTGSGIPPEELPRIFDRFYKGPSSRGSGLGLTIARNLVIAHGGEISAESEVGRGTMIRFTLPLGSRG